MTRQTLHPIPILPLEEVHNQTIVSHAIDLPLLLARDLGRQPLELGLALGRPLDLRLLQDPVEVFV